MSYFTLATSLSEKSRRFLSHMANSGACKNRSASLAIGRVIGTMFPLPATDVTSDIGMYWRANHMLQASAKFDALNEMSLHNREEVMKYAEAFYSHRVHSAYLRPTSYGQSGSESQFYHFFGMTQYFDIDTLKHIATNTDDLTSLCDGYADIFKDLDRVN